MGVYKFCIEVWGKPEKNNLIVLRKSSLQNLLQLLPWNWLVLVSAD